MYRYIDPYRYREREREREMGGTINQRTTGGPFYCISVKYHGRTVILTSIRTSSRHVFFVRDFPSGSGT